MQIRLLGLIFFLCFPFLFAHSQEAEDQKYTVCTTTDTLQYAEVKEILGEGDARLRCTDDTGGVVTYKSHDVQSYHLGHNHYVPAHYHPEENSGVTIFVELVLEKGESRLYRRYCRPTSYALDWVNHKNYLNKGVFYIESGEGFESQIEPGDVRKDLQKHFGKCKKWNDMVKKMRLSEANYGMAIRRFAHWCGADPEKHSQQAQ